MCKKELFNEVLENVCRSLELDGDSVMHSNKEECVDARYVVIAVLSERLSDRQIAEVSGWSVQLVNKARNAFVNRCKFRWGLKGIYKELCIFVEKK
jgi:isopentenyldiphosphate isomerase